MQRVVFAFFTFLGIGVAVFFLTQDRTTWATSSTPRSFIFDDVTLRVVETGAVADMDELAADPFLGGLFVGMDDMLRTETARGYAFFDPETNALDLHIAGMATQVTYDPAAAQASASLDGAGPIEVHWDHKGLSANIVAPVMMFGAPSEWAFHVPLVPTEEVAARITAQQDIVAQAIADKAAWRERMTDFAEEHADALAVEGAVHDVWLAGWQATLSYPESATFIPERSVLGGRVILPDNQVVQISGYSAAQAAEKIRLFKASIEALPDDEKIIVRDTGDLFIAVPYDGLINILIEVPLEHMTYTVSANLQYWDDIGLVRAMSQSLQQRPLGAPPFDPLTLKREEARVMMGLPTFKVGRQDDPDPTFGLRNDLEVMLRDESLMSHASNWVNRESNFWAYRTDDEYGSLIFAELECFPVLGAPETASALHDTYLARAAFDPKLAAIDVSLMEYITSDRFAAGLPYQDKFDLETPAMDATWFADTPTYAFGAYGPYYMAYRVDRLGDVSIFCAVHDVDPWMAWMKMDLHSDVERPAPVTLQPQVREQFGGYPEARAFGPGHFLIGVPFTDGKHHLIAGDGTVLIPERLDWWDWHPQTQSITAEDENDKVGLYLTDGTQLLPHRYEDIDTWANLGPTVMRVRNADSDLFYDISQRAFIPDPTH